MSVRWRDATESSTLTTRRTSLAVDIFDKLLLCRSRFEKIKNGRCSGQSMNTDDGIATRELMPYLYP